MKRLFVAKMCHHSGYFPASRLRQSRRNFGTVIPRVLFANYSNHNIVRIDADAFGSNIRHFKRELIPDGSKLCIVLKANAYGHGITELAPVAAANNVDYIGIVDNWEAQYIREALKIVHIPIIRLRPALVEEIMHGTQWGIEETIGSIEQVDAILGHLSGGSEQHSMYTSENSELNTRLSLPPWPRARKQDMSEQDEFNFHLDLDTGIGRSGIAPKNFKKAIDKILGYTAHSEAYGKNNRVKLNVKGLMTHFAAADEDTIEGINATEDAMLKFDNTVLNDPESIEKLSQLAKIQNKNSNSINNNNFELLYHCSNSGHLLSKKCKEHYEKIKPAMDNIRANKQLNFRLMVRPGTMAYGLDPDHYSPFGSVPSDLKPVFSWSTRIVQINKRAKGDNVGYGLEYTCPDERLVATMPIGYADGYLRKLGNKSQVLIHGTRCDVIGRISMDIFTVDITHLKNDNVKLGDECVLVGKQGKHEIKMAEISSIVGTCTRELPCLIGNIDQKQKKF